MQLDQVRGADNIVGLSSIYEIIVHKILYDFTVRKGSPSDTTILRHWGQLLGKPLDIHYSYGTLRD